MAWKNIALAGAVALSLGAGAAQAKVVYLAPADATNQIGFSPCCGSPPGGTISGAYGVGDTVTFAGKAPIQLTTVDLFGYAGGGSKPIEVDLYAGTDPNVGSFLGSATTIPQGNGYTTEVFNFAGLTVPQTLTYIVSIVGNSGSYDDSFVNWQQFTGAAGSPSVGSSSDMWYGSPGAYVADNSYAVATGAQSNTLAVQFNAVPEPAAWALMLLGLGMVGGVLRDARRKTAMATATI